MKKTSRLSASQFHFVGVGGIGMCGLAELLHRMGAKVTGSDVAVNANIENLKKLGIEVFIGHEASNVGDASVVVYSSAISSENKEIKEAKSRNLPVIRRAEALAEIMRSSRGVAVAGTHGKTTTTGFVSCVFMEAKMDPTIVVGGRFDRIQSTAQLGQGEWLVAEADESDGSFRLLSPELTIITNIDDDHLDHYGSLANLKLAFYDFACNIPFYGAVIACGDNAHVREALAEFPKRKILYGFNRDNDYCIEGKDSKYDILHFGKKVGQMNLQLPGRHNALNALAAVICGLQAGINIETAIRGVESYQGIGRRFEFKGKAKGVDVYDDYAHHPTELLATLQAFREKFQGRRIVALFQPHRYSRTELCWNEFTQSFNDCDVVLVTDVYAAGELPRTNINSERLAKEIKHKTVKYVGTEQAISEQVATHLKDGDVFVTLGAGSVWKVGMSFVKGSK